MDTLSNIQVMKLYTGYSFIMQQTPKVTFQPGG